MLRHAYEDAGTRIIGQGRIRFLVGDIGFQSVRTADTIAVTSRGQNVCFSTHLRTRPVLVSVIGVTLTFVASVADAATPGFSWASWIAWPSGRPS